MSRLTQTPPLFSLNSEENEPVRTHVNEPFIRRPESKRTQTTMQLLALFGHLELVLTQINRLRRDQKAFTAKTDDWLERLVSEADKLKTQIESAWSQLDIKGENNKQKCMNILKISILYPLAYSHVAETGGNYDTLNGRPDIPPAFDAQSHYQRIAMYDQLFATAARLYQSVDAPDHHYIPYQLAILYMCISRIGVPGFSAQIESRFTTIREFVTQKENNGETAQLDPETIGWLKKMISDLIQQIFQSLEDESGKKSARDSALCDVIFHHVQNVAQFANTVNCLDF